MPLSRREFVQATGAVGGMALLAPLFGCAPPLRADDRTNSPRASRIDHVLVLMQENRSFDHYFGWRTASNRQVYADHHGRHFETYRLAGDYRGCGYRDPDHSWEGGRRQLTEGFATGSHDRFALGYYGEDDVPFYAALAREFTLCDHYFSSVLGPTYPNRAYMHSAQCGGLRDNRLPTDVGHRDGFPWPTIWDRLQERGISWAYYFVDLPVIALFGSRLSKGTRSIADFYTDAATGVLPSVAFIDPGFTNALHTDEHPAGDIRAGQAFAYSVVRALVTSPAWERSVLFINYDEWGGFFDTRSTTARERRSRVKLVDDFRQLGFRVPCTIVSPYARRGALASDLVPAGRCYDHTSILKLIENRHGLRPLTRRDRAARDIGELPGSVTAAAPRSRCNRRGAAAVADRGGALRGRRAAASATRERRGRRRCRLVGTGARARLFRAHEVPRPQPEAPRRPARIAGPRPPRSENLAQHQVIVTDRVIGDARDDLEAETPVERRRLKAVRHEEDLPRTADARLVFRHREKLRAEPVAAPRLGDPERADFAGLAPRPAVEAA
jgi:phospholipase C